MDDIYRNPGPLQFDGPGADAKPITLNVEDQDYMGRIKKLQEYLEQVFTAIQSYLSIMYSSICIFLIENIPLF
jgi:pyrophosphate--fructose-6-phosphate 1-phosphotransferase